MTNKKIKNAGFNLQMHVCPLQLDIIERLITRYSNEGDVVIDPCAGSGTTLRAARNLGRHSYGFECYKPF